MEYKPYVKAKPINSITFVEHVTVLILLTADFLKITIYFIPNILKNFARLLFIKQKKNISGQCVLVR